MVCESTLHSFVCSLRRSNVVVADVSLVHNHLQWTLLYASLPREGICTVPMGRPQINIDFDGLCWWCPPPHTRHSIPALLSHHQLGMAHIARVYEWSPSECMCVEMAKSNKRKRFIKCAKRNSLLGHYFSIQFLQLH